MLKEKDVKLLLKHRYGSTKSFKNIIASYAAIGRSTGLKGHTIQTVINRFHANGNKFIKNPYTNDEQ